jgi:hypothetical protein
LIARLLSLAVSRGLFNSKQHAIRFFCGLGGVLGFALLAVLWPLAVFYLILFALLGMVVAALGMVLWFGTQ